MAKTIRLICSPLKIFKINTEDIEVMVCISLSIITILRKNLEEVKEACKAKNIDFNLKNAKTIFAKFFLSLIERINQLEEALIAKGYGIE